jgi:hypothetical protein
VLAHGLAWGAEAACKGEPSNTAAAAVSSMEPAGWAYTLQKMCERMQQRDEIAAEHVRGSAQLVQQVQLLAGMVQSQMVHMSSMENMVA